MGQTYVWRTLAFFRRKGHLTPKINITFFITNLMINMFVLNKFFEKLVFSGESAQKCYGGAQCVIIFGQPCIS